MNTQRLLTTMIASILLAGGALGEAVMHGRISAETGGALIRGSEDADWSYATVNTLVLPGDTLWADERGTVEIELYGGTFVRFADKSKAEIASVPPEALIRGWSGSFYVQRLARSTGNVALSTPAATIRVDKDSMVRVDIVGEGSTTVSVRWGRATVETASGRPVMLGRNQRTYVDPGLLPSTPSYFDMTVEDDFDIWNQGQAQLLALGEDAFQAPVQETAPPVGATSLAGYGEWVTIDSQPYWRPTVVVDFVPYRVGYWSYVPRYGHVWVGAYPFSYVTSHYGRWTRHPRHGWCWTYREGWSPAWVASYRYGDNYVWSPLDIYDRPVSYGEAHFRIGDVTISIATSSYCSANDLAWGPAMVHPMQPRIVNVVNQEIHIWNLGNQYRVPSFARPQGDGRPVLQVRDYNPQRVIRGPEAGGGQQGLVARSRAATLEQGSVRDPFRAAAAPGSRGVRTSVNSGTRNAQIRSTRLAPEAGRQATAAVQRVERGNVGIRARGGDAAPGRDDRITPERTLGNIRTERGPDSDRVTRRPTEPLTPSDIGASDRVTRRTDGVDRTPQAVTPDRSRTQDRLGSGRGAAGGDRTPTRVQTPSRTPAPSREAGPDRTPDRTPARRPESVRQTPAPTPQQVTPRSTRTPEQTPDRTPARRPESVRQTPAPTPQQVTPRSTRTPEQTPDRTPARRPESVRQTPAPTPQQVTPRSTRGPESVRQTPNPAPRQVTPRSTRTPATVRQTPTPAPQRVQPRSAQATPAPRPNTWQRPSAPSQSPTPQVRAPQASRNVPSSPPRVAQPSPPASQPQVQAPSPRPNRSAAPAPVRPNTGARGAAGNRARGR